jgi:hypothetical protein
MAKSNVRAVDSREQGRPFIRRLPGRQIRGISEQFYSTSLGIPLYHLESERLRTSGARCGEEAHRHGEDKKLYICVLSYASSRRRPHKKRDSVTAQRCDTRVSNNRFRKAKAHAKK